MFEKTINNFRKYKSKRFEPLANFLIKIGLTANIMTTLSLMSGLIAVYFLFNNYLYFIIVGILHLFFDAFDGVLARKTKETKFGKNYDYVTDNFIAILLLIKLGWYLNDIYPYIIAGLYTLAILIYLIRNYSCFFIRTTSFIVLAVALFPGFPFEKELLVIGYLVGGIVTVYSLATQLQHFLKKN